MRTHRTIQRGVATVAAGAMVLAACAPDPGTGPGPGPANPERITVGADGTEANGNSTGHDLSGDGRYVAFQSNASNIVAGDTNGRADIFLHDRLADTMTRVSTSTAGEQANGNSYTPSISNDGRYVVFESAASNLVATDTNGERDVFLHDTVTGSTTMVSVGPGGVLGNERSHSPDISADGNRIAFVSDATNLVPSDVNAEGDVFLRDRVAGTTTLLSISSAGAQADNDSRSPAISDDGSFVAFHSFSDKIVTGDTNNNWDVFVRDLGAGTTWLASLSTDGTHGNAQSTNASISGDGRYVAFSSTSSNLVPSDLNGSFDIFVRDQVAGTTTRISRPAPDIFEGGSNGTSDISSDGRFYAFSSSSQNLVPYDSNGEPDVFVFDLVNETTSRASTTYLGSGPNDSAGNPAISDDGTVVAYGSYASDIVPGDLIGRGDVFVFDLSP